MSDDAIEPQAETINEAIVCIVDTHDVKDNLPVEQTLSRLPAKLNCTLEAAGYALEGLGFDNPEIQITTTTDAERREFSNSEQTTVDINKIIPVDSADTIIVEMHNVHHTEDKSYDAIVQRIAADLERFDDDLHPYDIAIKIALGEPLGFVNDTHHKIYESACAEFGMNFSTSLLEKTREDIAAKRPIRELLEKYERNPNTYNTFTLYNACKEHFIGTDDLLELRDILNKAGEEYTDINPLVLAAYILIADQYGMVGEKVKRFYHSICMRHDKSDKFFTAIAKEHLLNKTMPLSSRALKQLLEMLQRNIDLEGSRVFEEAALAAGIGPLHIRNVRKNLTEFQERPLSDYAEIVGLVAAEIVFALEIGILDDTCFVRFEQLCNKYSKVGIKCELEDAERRIGLRYVFPARWSYAAQNDAGFIGAEKGTSSNGRSQAGAPCRPGAPDHAAAKPARKATKKSGGTSSKKRARGLPAKSGVAG
jgi:hypothetical protein